MRSGYAVCEMEINGHLEDWGSSATTRIIMAERRPHTFQEGRLGLSAAVGKILTPCSPGDVD
jgi:hypothetical protein